MERFRRLATILFVIVAMLAPVARGNAFAQADTLTCDDFTNQDAAQIVLDEDDTFAEALDEDGDGEACPDLPARDEPANEDATVALGVDKTDFEDGFGEPADDSDEDEFSIGTEYEGNGAFEPIHVFWLNDVAAHVSVDLAFELDEDDAYDLAVSMLPSDADVDTEGEDLEDGGLLFAGQSDEIADLFTDADYDDLEVGGQAGDVRIILILDDGNVTTMDIAIGLGEEFVGASTDPKPTEETEEPSGDAEEYLGSVRDSVDVLLDESETFNTLFLGGEELSEADLDVLVEILVHWSTVTTESDAVTAPDGYEEIQSAFEDTTAAFESVSAIIAEGENADVEQAIANFDEAQTLLNDLDDLLNDEGV